MEDSSNRSGGKARSVGKRQMRRNRSQTIIPALSAWQLPRTNTRRSARIAREVYTAWGRRVGPVGTITRLPAEQVQTVFNDMELYPTKAQVYDMLQCAKDCSDRNSASYLTFGEFCTFATELKRCYEKGVSCSASLTKLLDKDGKRKKKQAPIKLSKMMPKHEVFLGGSCNPTTWRQDVAIPMLNKLGITFYNPQVDKWSSDLLELEYRIKENASVLFYVISSETRNVAGIIEAAHLAGARRKLILVIDRYRPGQSLCGEPISQQEYEELTTSLKVLQSLVEGQGIPVFHDIPLAINCTAKVLRDDLNSQNLEVSDYSVPVKINNYQNGDSLIKLKEAFNSLNKKRNGQIYLSDVYVACRILMNRKISVPELKRIITPRSDCVGARNSINFEEFCSIVSNLKANCATVPPSNSCASTAGGLNGSVNGKTEKCMQCSRTESGVSTVKVYDVFIGGCSTNYSWAEDAIIPVLKKNNLSYYCGTKTSEYKRLDLSLDDNAINNCFVMFFYIPADARGLATMAMAAHYIGLGCNVVLFVQHLPEAAKAFSSNDTLNEQSISDYNRGRIYLTDLAERDDIPVLTNLEEAVRCLVEKCTGECSQR